MTKKLIVGNWKMNGARDGNATLSNSGYISADQDYAIYAWVGNNTLDLLAGSVIDGEVIMEGSGNTVTFGPGLNARVTFDGSLPGTITSPNPMVMSGNTVTVLDRAGFVLSEDMALALAAMGGGAGMLGAGMMNSGVAVSVFSSSVWVRLGLTGAAFGGAVLAVLLTLVLSRGVQHTLRLLLAGVVVGVVLAAMTHLVLVFSPESLQAMQAFMLGSTSFVGWTACVLMVAVWALCALAAWLLARVLDGLSLGDATARSLGLPLGPMRAALVAVLALATGTAVAQTGLIAFVGLAAPHLVRAVVSVRHGRLMLLASLMGAALLAGADLLARGLMAPQELPVGVLTAVLGGGYLLWLMHRRTAPGGQL